MIEVVNKQCRFREEGVRGPREDVPIRCYDGVSFWIEAAFWLGLLLDFRN